MKETSRTYEIGEDLLVKLYFGKGRVGTVVIKREGEDDITIDAESLDRVSRLITVTNDIISTKFRTLKVCIDHGYHETYSCEKCNPTEEQEK